MAAVPAPEQEYVYVQPRGIPGRMLSFALFPVALAPPIPLPWPDWGSFHPLCPYMVLVLIVTVACGAGRGGCAGFLSWPIWLFLAALLALQAVAMHASAVYWEIRPMDALGPYGQLLQEAAPLFLYAVGMRLLCAVPEGPAWLARGAIFSLVLLLGVCGLQLVWLLSGPEFRDWLGQGVTFPALSGSVGKTVTALHERLRPVLEWVGDWLEARASLHPDPIYENGAYTLTMLRVNGVFATASDLAVILSTAYAPFILAGVTTTSAWGRWLCALLAIGMIVVLIGGRSPAALVACLFLLTWLGLRVLWRPGRRVRALLVMLLIAGLSIGALYHDPASRRLVARMSEPGAMPLPEETVARELWDLVQDHPWIGVGYGWSSAYVIHGRRYAQSLHTDETPELQIWREDVRILPTPSLLLEFLAVFGIPLAMAVAISFFWLWLRLRRLARQPGAEPGRRFALAAGLPYLSAVAVFILSDVDWTNPLLLLPYFGLWAMVDVWERSGAGLAAHKVQKPGKGRRSPAVPKSESMLSSSSRPFTRSGGA